MKEEKVLLRDGKPVAITPKAFQLLLVLVENHGHLVEKDELMKTVWSDRFVEEGNLSYTILLLRKTLGDGKNEPRFIETVSKRGYRFIAEVELLFDSGPEKTKILTEPSTDEVGFSFGFRNLMRPITLFLAACVIIGLASWYIKSNNKPSPFPVLSAPFAAEKLSNSGRVINAIITPDGKNVVYSNRDASNKESLWLRQLDSSDNIQIIPPSDDIYGGLVSTDGEFIYFSRKPRDQEGDFTIYRVSSLGGVPETIVSDTLGLFSLSSDGTKISFVRLPSQNEKNYSLWIADLADIQNGRKLASRPQPLRIDANAISPDGKSVAFTFGQSNNRSAEFSLAEIDLESGAERLLTPLKFFNIKRLIWLPDKSGVLLTASEQPGKRFRIWKVSSTTGDAEPLTNDSENYFYLSLDKDGKTLISTQVKEDKNLYLLNIDKPSDLQNLSYGSSASFISSAKILFQSVMLGGNEIWSMNIDGSDLRQLTNSKAEGADSLGSPDNKQIFFISTRTGKGQVWRMNADGSNQQQITFQEGGIPIFVSLDENWVYFTHGIERTLWRASTKGGDEQLVLNKRSDNFAISPDGLQVAFIESEDKEGSIKVLSLTYHQVIKTIRFKRGKVYRYVLTWTPDGKRIAYVFQNENGQNIIQLQSLADEKTQQIYETTESIYSLSFAPGGKNLTVVKGSWKHDAVLLRGLK